jgi:transposase
VCLEEGTQSTWLYEILSPHAEEVLVVMVPESRGQKNDAKDAFSLAEQLRTGAIQKHVFKEVGEYGTLRELGRTHTMVVQDVVRVQNRIKALFRSRGIAVVGKSVYSEEGREACLKKLPHASRGAATTLYAQYDAVEAIRRQAEKDLVTEAHRHPMSRVLESCPGLGPIRVAQLMLCVAGSWRTAFCASCVRSAARKSLLRTHASAVERARRARRGGCATLRRTWWITFCPTFRCGNGC